MQQAVYKLSESNDDSLFCDLVEMTLNIGGMLVWEKIHISSLLNIKHVKMPRHENCRIDFKGLRDIIENHLGPIILTDRNETDVMNYFIPRATKLKDGTRDPYIRGNYDNIDPEKVFERYNKDVYITQDSVFKNINTLLKEL